MSDDQTQVEIIPDDKESAWAVAGFPAAPPGRPGHSKVEGSLRAAHYYYLRKTIISEHKAAKLRKRYKKAKQDPTGRAITAWDMRARGGQNNKAVALFLYRCAQAEKYLRDEFAALMHLRVTLCLHRKTNDEACDWIDLSRAELKELDDIITKNYGLKLPRRHFDAGLPMLNRRMKRGSAKDRLRRYRQGLYNQSQLMSFQQDSPLSL